MALILITTTISVLKQKHVFKIIKFPVCYRQTEDEQRS